MRLPAADRAVVVPEKVRDYLLKAGHPVGQSKGAFFAVLGYTQENWTLLQNDLLHLAQSDQAVAGRASPFGSKYEIRGTLVGPNGRSAMVVTAWIVRHGEDFPRFVTAHPDR